VEDLLPDAAESRRVRLRVSLLLVAALDGAKEDADQEADDDQVEDYLRGDEDAGRLGWWQWCRRSRPWRRP
jgi:hypothetical protein